ncbi:hypothetical protein P8452_51540 [Trifolium repens]|nr:hypothetical protein P8452_51540 [Trifolium repens]
MLVNKKLHEDRKTKFSFKALETWKPASVRCGLGNTTASPIADANRMIADANCILKGCIALYHNSIHS